MLSAYRVKMRGGGRTNETNVCFFGQSDRPVDASNVCGTDANGQPTSFHNHTALHQAANSGSHACVSYLLENGALSMATNSHGSTPLHEAALHGRLTCLRVMLGVRDPPFYTPEQVNAVDEDGRTALMMATRHSCEKCCAMLIEAGADLFLRDIDGSTALQIAKHHHPDKLSLHSLLAGRLAPSQCGSLCDNCGKAGGECRDGLFVCQCEKAVFCSRRCQRAAWEGHRPECERLRAEKEKKNAPMELRRNADGRMTAAETR